MTWLYTILFSGLIFSAGPDVGSMPVPAAPRIEVSSSQGDITARLDKSYPLSAEGRVSISNTNGRIELEAWDKEEAALVVEKTGPSKEILDTVKVIVDSDKERFRLRTEQQDWYRGNSADGKRQVQVVIKMKLPRRAVLDEIENVNGEISISGFSNSVSASSVNGGVTISGLKGRLEASTVNGPISAEYGQLDPQTRVELSSVNGPVKVTIPTDSDVTLKGETLNGGIKTDFALSVRKADFVGHSLYSRLGSGAASMSLESVNGPLYIGHPNDGRSPAPSTDLSSENGGDDNVSGLKGRRINARLIAAEAEKAAAEAKSRSAKAMKDALKTAQVETARTMVLTAPLVERSVKEALDAARERLKAADIGKAAAVEARRALRMSSKTWDFGSGFGNERVFGADTSIGRQTKSFPVSGTPKVTINAPGCSVRIVGTDESVVRYTVTKIRSANDDISNEIKEKADSRSVEINVSGDTEEKWRTRLEVFVPHKTNLKVVTDGELRIDGVSGKLDLKGEDESITLRGSGGNLTVASSTGRIRVIGFRGEVNAETELGTVDLDGEFDALTARSDLGDILITLPSNFSGKIDSGGEGAVRFDGLSATRVEDNEDRFVYRIGSGDRSYVVQTDGNLMIRSSDTLLNSN